MYFVVTTRSSDGGRVGDPRCAWTYTAHAYMHIWNTHGTYVLQALHCELLRAVHRFSESDSSL